LSARANEWVLADVEARLTEIRAMLGCLSDKLDALLAAFEPRGVVLAEDLLAQMEAARGRQEGFVKNVARDAVQYTMGLVKSHFLEVDLEPVGDGVALDCSDEDWEAHHSSVKPLADCIVADLDL